MESGYRADCRFEMDARRLKVRWTGAGWRRHVRFLLRSSLVKAQWPRCAVARVSRPRLLTPFVWRVKIAKPRNIELVPFYGLLGSSID